MQKQGQYGHIQRHDRRQKARTHGAPTPYGPPIEGDIGNQTDAYHPGEPRDRERYTQERIDGENSRRFPEDLRPAQPDEPLHVDGVAI